MGRGLEEIGNGEHLDVVVETGQGAGVHKADFHGTLLHLLRAGALRAELRAWEQLDLDPAFGLVLDMVLEGDKSIPLGVVTLRRVHAELDRLGHRRTGGAKNSGGDGGGQGPLDEFVHRQKPFSFPL
jgi:hypothetical protein